MKWSQQNSGEQASGPLPISPPLLDCQSVEYLYHNGAKLWRKEWFTDFERQLAQSTQTKFTVTSFDGEVRTFTEESLGVKTPTCKREARFREYWELIHSSNNASNFGNCTYLPFLRNPIPKPGATSSRARQMFLKSLERWRLKEARKVNKIVCSGLGDIFQAEETQSWNGQLIMLERPLLHHAIARTTFDVANSLIQTQERKTRLLTQDPGYLDQTKSALDDLGWEVVGEHGAGGRTDHCGSGPANCYHMQYKRTHPSRERDDNLSRPPWVDPESPRTREMWKEYTRYDLGGEPGYKEGLDDLEIYVKTGNDRGGNGSVT
ncbi:hypothetical protein NPX13_g5217 [Xylaria arbuscula]|uniref:Uncharacterized protein n=1 Tax=Xylaria arbuscula TaxID=114810 RepID=A0A9W8NE24_9PEZI|nr:hypothetical protein NPX13_g5217 [Xylaria arbuscula]